MEETGLPLDTEGHDADDDETDGEHHEDGPERVLADVGGREVVRRVLRLRGKGYGDQRGLGSAE